MGKTHRRFRPVKWLLQRRTMQQVLVWLAALYIRLVYYSSRWQWHIPDATRRLLDSGQPVIYAFWHGRLMMMHYSWLKAHQPQQSNAGMRMHVLISEHRDGLFIADVSRHFNVGTIHGSSSKSALTGVRQCLRRLRQGDAISITPDGPRGPLHSVAPGIIAIAQKTKIPIIPWSFSTSRGKELKSWDRFWLAKPWSRGVYVAGEPLQVEDMTTESAEHNLQTALKQCNDRADAAVQDAIVQQKGM
jgi:lysophospholipid acyltransferase (LPLAT)-like uncharacterized protein